MLIESDTANLLRRIRMPRDKTAKHIKSMAAARQEFLEYGYEKDSIDVYRGSRVHIDGGIDFEQFLYGLDFSAKSA